MTQTQTTPVEGSKDKVGKAELDLIPYEGLEGTSRGLAYGRNKYGRGNFKKGLPWTDIIAALLRHGSKWANGEELDKESGLCHLDHIAANAAILLYYKATGKGLDDR